MDKTKNAAMMTSIQILNTAMRQNHATIAWFVLKASVKGGTSSGVGRTASRAARQIKSHRVQTCCTAFTATGKKMLFAFRRPSAGMESASRAVRRETRVATMRTMMLSTVVGPIRVLMGCVPVVASKIKHAVLQSSTEAATWGRMKSLHTLACLVWTALMIRASTVALKTQHAVGLDKMRTARTVTYPVMQIAANACEAEHETCD